MRPGTTFFLYNTMVSSHQFYTWDQGPLSVYATSWSLLTNSIHKFISLYMQHHGLFTPIPYMRPGTTFFLYNTMVSSHQFYTWDQGPLSVYATSWSLLTNSIHKFISLSIQHHGLFSLIPYMRQGTILSFFTTPWSLLTKSIHETRAYSICLQHHGLFMPGPYMRPYTPWSLPTNSIHETRDHSTCLQFHGLF